MTWKDIRQNILARDGNACSECKDTEKLHVHHKDKNRKNNSDENLITLCFVCHMRAHGKLCWSLPYNQAVKAKAEKLWRAGYSVGEVMKETNLTRHQVNGLVGTWNKKDPTISKEHINAFLKLI